jgi:tryptophan synthase alpha chain
MSSDRIQQAFAAAAERGRAAFVAYLTAGDPDNARSLAAGRALLEHVDLLEVGLPFSDPLGDGPTIQRASERALAAGASTASTLALVRDLRAESDKPIVIMTYYNPIYAYRGPEGEGEAAFVAAAVAAGADGLILPDLPPDEGAELIAAARAHDLGTTFLVAPTSTDQRLRIVGEACRGFVYAVSVTGVTGARAGVPAEVHTLVKRAQQASHLPVAVGFGVASAASARAVAAFADGVVVGSALVERIGKMENPDDVAGLSAFAAELAAAMPREVSPIERQ